MGQLVRHRGVVFLCVRKRRVVRHPDEVVRHPVERPAAAMADVGMGAVDEVIQLRPALGGRTPLDPLGVVALRQAVELLGVEHVEGAQKAEHLAPIVTVPVAFRLLTLDRCIRLVSYDPRASATWSELRCLPASAHLAFR